MNHNTNNIANVPARYCAPTHFIYANLEHLDENTDFGSPNPKGLK